MTHEPLFTSRRDFLTGSLTFLSAATTLPLFLGRTARALAGDGPAASRDDSSRILVVVQLAGGNDGLNTIVPYTMDEYYKARRTLAVPKADVLKLEQNVGLNPAAEGLKSLYDDGLMAVVQGVGYPNPNRSHFQSMDIWHSADPDLRKHSGWLGRYFDSCCTGSDPGPEPIAGVAMMKEAPAAMYGEDFMPLAFDDINALTWRGNPRDARAVEAFRKLNNIDGDLPAGGHEMAQYLQRAALKAQVGADNIRAAVGRSLPSRRRGGRGGELGRQLDVVARMIAADLPTRVYYVSMGGFDTHTGQAGRHRQLLTQFGEAMNDFVRTLAESKLLDRVLVLTFSEFGRRVQENASGGTDHGEAAPMFLFGSAVRPGVHEKHPSLASLHRGDLSYGVDFRRIYATVLRQWLKAQPEKVIGGGFQPMKLLKV
ncbi:MAG: DUF1501 domain-containing protein [Phycisphaerales bacterium]|nr:DUF1501 domain-containing protein [Phycisphaerales bacterium]